jgi:4-aminobutyrate aminotransferase-like enzyme
VKGLLKPKPFFPFFKKKTDVLPANLAPRIRTKSVPGPKSLKLAESLRRFECPQITYLSDSFPVFLERAWGANAVDADGNRFLDLTSCFGVAGIGHSSPAVVEAVKRQSRIMIHGMGDVHPNALKAELAERLAQVTPGNLSQTIFSLTGAEAVESAMKTAVMHTKKSGLIAFDGGYHGLSYGALQATDRADFKAPFARQLGKHVQHAPFPDPRIHGGKASEVSMKAVERLVKKAKRSPHPVGAVLIEPIQGRGGIRVAPPDFLKALRDFCDKQGILLIADEVFTGFGRTGAMFAVEKSGIVPDLLCVGKGLGGGLPISACVGSAKVMRSWGVSSGDAIHTSTFLGHPLASAAALAVLREIESKKLVERSRTLGESFRRELHRLKSVHALIGDVRGSGLMIGLELNEPLGGAPGGRSRKPQGPPPATAQARTFVLESLRAGLLVLACGPAHNVISITPPFVLTEKDIRLVVGAFDRILKKIGQGGFSV